MAPTREWTREEHGDIAHPDFDEHLAAWFARELPGRIMWMAEDGGRPVGMMNLAIYERMPRPGAPEPPFRQRPPPGAPPGRPVDMQLAG